MVEVNKKLSYVPLVIVALALLAGFYFRLVRSHAEINHAVQTSAIETIQSEVSREAVTLFQWDAMRVDYRASLEKIQMLSATHGWAASLDGALYKTQNGGDTWQRTSLKAPRESYLTSMFFVNDSRGWIVFSRTGFSFNDTTNKGTYDIACWVMSTRDGGQSWTVGYSAEGVQIINVLFVDNDEGWAIGRRLSKGAPQTDTNFVIHTANQGRSWTDVSNRLPVTGRGIDAIYAVEPQSATLLTSDGMILGTRDGGWNWNELDAVHNQDAQTSFLQMGMTDYNRLWLLAGTSGIEGTRSVLVRKGNHDNWTSYLLDQIYLSDAVTLGENKILACGSMATGFDPGHPRKEGVILFSTDGARTWTIAYRNSQVSSINELSVYGVNHIWAVGEGGVVLRLKSWP